MKLVEVVRTIAYGDEVYEEMVASTKTGQGTPVRARDSTELIVTMAWCRISGTRSRLEEG